MRSKIGRGVPNGRLGCIKWMNMSEILTFCLAEVEYANIRSMYMWRFATFSLGGS